MFCNFISFYYFKYSNVLSFVLNRVFQVAYLKINNVAVTPSKKLKVFLGISNTNAVILLKFYKD
jgi:hypothetical protein